MNFPIGKKCHDFEISACSLAQGEQVCCAQDIMSARFYSHWAGKIRCDVRISAVTWKKICLDRYQQIFVIDIDLFSIACDIIEYTISIKAKNIIEYPITIMQVSKKVLNINNETVLITIE